MSYISTMAQEERRDDGPPGPIALLLGLSRLFVIPIHDAVGDVSVPSNEVARHLINDGRVALWESADTDARIERKGFPARLPPTDVLARYRNDEFDRAVYQARAIEIDYRRQLDKLRQTNVSGDESRTCTPPSTVEDRIRSLGEQFVPAVRKRLTVRIGNLIRFNWGFLGRESGCCFESVPSRVAFLHGVIETNESNGSAGAPVRRRRKKSRGGGRNGDAATSAAAASSTDAEVIELLDSSSSDGSDGPPRPKSDSAGRKNDSVDKEPTTAIDAVGIS